MANTRTPEGYLTQDPHFATNALHEGQEPEQWNCLSAVPAIFPSTTYKQMGPANFKEFEYSRSGNPTRRCLEKCIASLEKANYGLTFASGLAATSTIVQMLSTGDHIVSVDDVYGGTNRFLNKVAINMGIKTTMVDGLDPINFANAMQSNTKLIWMETPTNPTLKIVDIEEVSRLCHTKNKDVVVVVDNTFLSSYFQKPLLLGADLVLHSLTKYMNGHTDVVMGAIATSNKILYEKLLFLQNASGAVPSPFDCYLVNRGLKTLHLRMQRHMENGLAVGKYLETHPCVEKVLHPGLPSHPQHELFKKQTSGSSGMCCFYLKGGLKESQAFFSHLKIFMLAESLGGYESLTELPSVMTHASVPPEQRAVLGITDNLIRLSVGLEDIQDLIDDLDNALRKAITHE